MSEEDEYEEAKEQVFNRRFRKPDATLMILAETSEVPIEDPDVADLAESAIRRKFGFKGRDPRPKPIPAQDTLR